MATLLQRQSCLWLQAASINFRTRTLGRSLLPCLRAKADLAIANTISDLIQGDTKEHLPLDRIPLKGDVLGLGTSTSFDNGELTFLQQCSGDTTIWKCNGHDGSIKALKPGDGESHFPYVCFSSDAPTLRTPVDLPLLGSVDGRPLQELVRISIEKLQADGRLIEAPIYGVRLRASWHELVITVASKLCMGQLRRNHAVAYNSASGAAATTRSIYDMLQHYRLADNDPCDCSDPIKYLGPALEWDVCGFYDTDPATGRVTVPEANANLHIHSCSTDMQYGGHLHHEHPASRLKLLEYLDIYPLEQIHHMGSDLAIEKLQYSDGVAHFIVANRGTLDVNDVGVAVVINDCYSNHKYLRLPWLSAGETEQFSVPLQLGPGTHQLTVIADPAGDIIEDPLLTANNRMSLDLHVIR